MTEGEAGEKPAGCGTQRVTAGKGRLGGGGSPVGLRLGVGGGRGLLGRETPTWILHGDPGHYTFVSWTVQCQSDPNANCRLW